jgi:hypothetical protein
MGTVITGSVLLGIVVAIIIKIYHDKKKGVCTGCSRCCESCEER